MLPDNRKDRQKFADSYVEKIVQAYQKLGPPKKNHLVLFRAEVGEHIPGYVKPAVVPSPIPGVREVLEGSRKAQGRWYGDRFEDLFFYLHHNAQEDTENNISSLRIKAIEVPVDVARAFYLDNLRDPQNFRNDKVPGWARKITGESLKKHAEYFFPRDFDVDAESPEASPELKKMAKEFLSEMDSKVRTVIDIPKSDIEKLTLDEWNHVAHRIDAAVNPFATRRTAKLHQIQHTEI